MSAAEPCILTVHAHPDDEASKGAPTLAKYASHGVRTVLVCCTGGEEGDIQNPALQGDSSPFHGIEGEERAALLHRVRMAELGRSADAIGFRDVVFLGYRDSGMKDSEANNNPECFHQADLDEAVGRLVTVIRRTRPQVMITYNDDQQGYPHPDHLKVHDISLPAFERAGDPMWYPWAGDPWQPSKLYYTVWSRARLLAVHQALIRLKGSSPYDEKWFERPDHDHRITTRIDVGEFLSARTQALLAHETQIDPAEPFWFGLSDEELAAAYPFEDWVLARSTVGLPADGELEHDLFEGLRELELSR
jgi:mycothiol S-conjugate amidase